MKKGTLLKRASLVALSAALITGSFAGCSSSSGASSQSSGGKTSDQAVTLKFTYRDDGSNTYKKLSPCACPGRWPSGG